MNDNKPLFPIPISLQPECVSTFDISNLNFLTYYNIIDSLKYQRSTTTDYNDVGI